MSDKTKEELEADLVKNAERDYALAAKNLVVRTARLDTANKAAKAAVARLTQADIKLAQLRMKYSKVKS